MSHEVFEHGDVPAVLSPYDFLDEYRVPLMVKPPQIDGHVEEAEWACAAGFDGLSYRGELEERRARAHVGATETHLYFAIVSELPPGGQLAAKVRQATDKLAMDDAVEIWIDPDPGADAGVAFQMLVNPLGCAAYLTHVRGQTPRDKYYGWQGDYVIANAFHDGFWHCEIAVPIEKIAPGRRADQGRWGINLCRDWKSPWGFSSLGLRGYNPADEIVFAFEKTGALAVQVRHEKDPHARDVRAVCRLHNPGPRAVRARAEMLLQRDKMPEVHVGRDVEVAPGRTEQVELAVEDRISDRFEMFTLVRMPERPGWQYTRFYRWGRPRKVRWDVMKAAAPPIDFQFAYYPYLNHMRVRADVTGLKDPACLEGIGFVVRPRGGGPAVAEFDLPAGEFVQGLAEKRLCLPPLNGSYEIVAEPRGRDLPRDRIVKTFQRTVFEWEHKGLGTSRKVYPPFTPIRVEGRTLRTVMKDYVLSDLGLLAQVRAGDQEGIGVREILAGPMTYRAVVDGRAEPPKAVSQRFVEVAEDVVVAESRFAMGRVNAECRSTLEYDGMLRLDLKLLASPGGRIDSLDLDIPILPDVAKLMHAMADGLRYPIYTAKVPDGQGVVWSARKLLSSEYPRNFCTYLFLGGPARGLCWFAENDRGWSWDPRTPNLELIRQDGAVVLRVHLVNRPFATDQERAMTFGVMAAPVKPRLPGWRHRWYTDGFSIIGTDIHWFALGCCASVYPAGKDLRLWEAIARSKKRPLNAAEIREVIRIGRKHFEPHGANLVKHFEKMAHQTLTNRTGTTTVLYYNRSSYAGAEEFQTFMDEWGMRDYHSWRGSNGRWEIKIVPAESYCDFAMHWYGKSFDVADNRGIYVDNIFFACSENMEMTSAYRREDGSIMPSTGLWDQRELSKRQFVYMNERDMEPITMVHLTSTQILPLHSFYTVQYDWEMCFSEGDVHTRFPREYLQTVSTGEQVGAWPIVLHEQGRCVADPWVLKTYLGVAIVHELIVDPYVWDVEPIPAGDTPENRLFETFRRPILEMAKDPGVKAYRYWDERPQPVRASHGDLPTIVYSLPGREALWAVTNYADSDLTAEVRIDPGVLGLVGGYRVIDVETGEELPVRDDTVTFPIRKHDLKEFRILPAAADAG